MFSNTRRVAHERGLDLMVAQSALGGRVTGVLAVSFSADRTRIVTGLSDKNVRLWDAATGHHSVSPCGDILVRLAQSRSRRTGITSRLARTTRLFGCGMHLRGSHSVSPFVGTLVR